MVKARRRRKILAILDLQNADLQGEIAKKVPILGIFLTEILIDPFFFSEYRRNINRPPKIFLNFSPIWVLRGGLLIVIPW